MKIALSQLNYHIGNFEQNNQKIIHSIKKAKSEGADLIVFAELAIGGYPAKDLLRNATFIDKCEKSIHEIAEHCVDIACIIGAPIRNTDGEGKALYNAALLLSEGKMEKIVKKSLLPDYDVFDEYRYFEPNKRVSCITFHDTKIALTICEDLWDNDFSNSYPGDIVKDLAAENPDLVINIAASPFSHLHFDKRIEVLTNTGRKTNAPIIYVNQIGAHTDIIFDGRSLALNKKGEVILELNAFNEDLRYIELMGNELKPSRNNPNRDEEDKDRFDEQELGQVDMNEDKTKLIHHALILGLKDYFHKSGFKKAVIGLSGGLDSAVVAALACEALGAENVLCVLMPSIYSSDHSLKDALDLVSNTGCKHLIVPIKDIAYAFEHSLQESFAGLKPDTTEENIQARSRGTILMAVSNKLGYILLNTSNKSEAAVGYGTLYGDMAGAISVIGDVYKTQAYELAEYINRRSEIIPLNTIEKAPSAELRPDQKDSDSLPSYDILDAILFSLIEMEDTVEEIIKSGHDETLVRRIANLVKNAEFKRYQAPPTLRVSSKAFGPGRSMPLVAKYF